MKNIIISISLIVLYVGLSVFLNYYPSDETDVYENIFELRKILGEPKTSNEAIKEIEPLLNSAIQGITLERFNELKDSVYGPSSITIEDVEQDSVTNVRVSSFVFQFDKNNQLDSIFVNGFDQSTWLDTSFLNYSPIYSSLIQSSEYPFHWGRRHLLWVIIVMIISILIVIKFVKINVKQDKGQLIEAMILIVTAIIINIVHLIIEFNFQINNNLLITIDFPEFPTEVTLIKTMGIMSHYNAIIFDVSIVFSVLLFGVMILYYRQEKKKEV